MDRENGEYAFRSRSFVFIAQFCVRRRQLGASKPLLCSYNHNEYDAKLYNVSDPNILQQLVSNGANINMKHCLTAETPLHTAVITRKSIKLVNQFLKLGADVNLADFKGVTPLHTAIQMQYIDAIVKLIHKGANVNQMSTSRLNFIIPAARLSPLDLAVRNLPLGKLVIRHTLLTHADKDPKTVIDLQPYLGRMAYEELSSYLLISQIEIAKMKSTKLSENISLFDFVVDVVRSKKMAKTNLFATTDILQALQQHPYEVYNHLIIEGIGRKKLLEELGELYDYLPLSARNKNREVHLDMYSLYSIVKFLPNKEMAYLLIASSFQDKNAVQSLTYQIDESVSTPEDTLSPFTENNTPSPVTEKDTLSTSTENVTKIQSSEKDTLTHFESDTLIQSTKPNTLKQLTKKYSLRRTFKKYNLRQTKKYSLRETTEKYNLRKTAMNATARPSTSRTSTQNEISCSTTETRQLAGENRPFQKCYQGDNANNKTLSFPTGSKLAHHINAGSLTKRQTEASVERPGARHVQHSESKAKRKKFSHP